MTEPDVGRSSPMIMRMVVDLPAPFGPRKPVTCPAWTVKLTPSTAVLLAVDLGQACCLNHGMFLRTAAGGCGMRGKFGVRSTLPTAGRISPVSGMIQGRIRVVPRMRGAASGDAAA